MNLFTTKKMTYTVNTVILLLVLGLMAFFYVVDAPFLVFFSFPTICVYLIGYVLIYKEWLDVYVWFVYVWLTLYMGITTVFLGYSYGFHLYCFSMIPVMFVTEYMSYRLKRRSLKALYVCVAIAILYLICTGSVAYFGPIYVRDQKYAGLFWILNALIVFGFLIFYTHYMLKQVIASELRLLEMAQVDRLTGLHNRHYMITHLEGLSEREGRALVMADIDDFKKINDRYGHNAGDEVLKEVSKRMKECCSGFEVSRWGGEEFLILPAGMTTLPDVVDVMEKLRQRIEAEPVIHAEITIPVTITAGIAVREQGQSVDAWVQAADEKMYFGKNNGKNKVVS